MDNKEIWEKKYKDTGFIVVIRIDQENDKNPTVIFERQ